MDYIKSQGEINHQSDWQGQRNTQEKENKYWLVMFYSLFISRSFIWRSFRKFSLYFHSTKRLTYVLCTFICHNATLNLFLIILCLTFLEPWQLPCCQGDQNVTPFTFVDSCTLCNWLFSAHICGPDLGSKDRTRSLSSSHARLKRRRWKFPRELWRPQ